MQERIENNKAEEKSGYTGGTEELNFRMHQILQIADIDRHIQFIRRIEDSYDFSEAQKKVIDSSLDKIIKKQGEKVLNMAVVGEFSSGKSSFINALLRKNLLETDAVQGTTVSSTLIRYSTEKMLSVFSEGGGGKTTLKVNTSEALANLLKMYTSDENKNESAQHVEVGYPSDFLKQGVCIIDTPGTNSLEQWHEDITKRTLREDADACIVLISAEKPLPETFCRFLEDNLYDILKNCIFVVTKIDLIPPKQQSRQIEYIKMKLRQYLEIEPQLVVSYSAMPVLNGTCLEYMQSNQETERSIIRFLQEQRVKIQIQRCMSLLERTIESLQENMVSISRKRKEEHEHLLGALKTDLNTFVVSQKRAMIGSFNESKLIYTDKFINKTKIDIRVNADDIYKEFSKTKTESDVRQFLQNRLNALLEEKKDIVLKNAGMQEGGISYFHNIMQSMLDEYRIRFEKSFKKEYEQLTVLANDLVENIDIEVQLDKSVMVNAQADISIRNKVTASDNKETKSFYGNLGAGVAAGAAIGSVVPIIGTTAGAIIGGIAGLARWGKKSDDVSKGNELRKQVSGDVNTMVEQYFTSLSESMTQAFRKGIDNIWTQLEKMMGQYLIKYTAVVNEMRNRDRRAQEAVAQEIQKIQNDMDLTQKRMEEIQSIKTKLSQL